MKSFYIFLISFSFELIRNQKLSLLSQITGLKTIFVCRTTKYVQLSLGKTVQPIADTAQKRDFIKFNKDLRNCIKAVPYQGSVRPTTFALTQFILPEFVPVCWYAKLNVFMFSAIVHFAQGHYPECHYAGCHYAGCHYV